MVSFDTVLILILFSKLLNKAEEGTVFDKQINKWAKSKLTDEDKEENLALAINSGKALGHNMSGVTPKSFMITMCACCA